MRYPQPRQKRHQLRRQAKSFGGVSVVLIVHLRWASYLRERARPDAALFCAAPFQDCRSYLENAEPCLLRMVALEEHSQECLWYMSYYERNLPHWHRQG
jgi:hypothetical protein